MPKHDFLTPKAIANRIKSKGLQKLRWYCQMCQKQCRDENGFKCHITSEAHQRQLLLVAENPGRVIGEFSREFLSEFLMLLRTSYGTRRVHANEVYQQYIKDKNHYHMNATRWETLTGFVMFLGREGICEVEDTPKGWFIKYVDRSPATLAKMAAANKKKKMDKDDEERLQKAIEEQIARALASKEGGAEEEEETAAYSELYRENEEEKIVLNFKGVLVGGIASASNGGMASTSEASEATPTQSTEDQESSPGVVEEGGRGTEEADSTGDREGVADATRGEAEAESPPSPSPSVASVSRGGGFSKSRVPPAKLPSTGNVFKMAGGGSAMKKKDKKSGKEGDRKRSALEEIREAEERKKIKLSRTDHWILEGIVVKVVHRKMGEKYYKKKGKVLRCKDRYTAVVEMLESRDVLKIDQAYLETVIPALGGTVRVVNGGYRGVQATLDSIDMDNYSATVTISKGPTRGRVVKDLPYEDICKLAI